MYPLLQNGETVFLEPVHQVDLHMIVVYSLQGKLIIHRVVKVCGDLLITRGDNSYRFDPPISRQHILAQVQYKLYQGEKVLLTGGSPSGRCGEDGTQDPDRVFRYLTNQFLKGLHLIAYWMSEEGFRIPIPEAGLELPGTEERQQLPLQNTPGITGYLFQNVNLILAHLRVVGGEGESVQGLGVKNPTLSFHPLDEKKKEGE